MEKMKPCPFCGSEDIEYDDDGGFVVCNEPKCGMMGPDGLTTLPHINSPVVSTLSEDEAAQLKAEAIRKWNVRAKVPEPPEIYCELCPKDGPSPAVYEAWFRKRDPFLGTKTGHLFKVYICEGCKVHPHLCINDKEEKITNEVPTPAGNRS